MSRIQFVDNKAFEIPNDILDTGTWVKAKDGRAIALMFKAKQVDDENGEYHDLKPSKEESRDQATARKQLAKAPSPDSYSYLLLQTLPPRNWHQLQFDVGSDGFDVFPDLSKSMENGPYLTEDDNGNKDFRPYIQELHVGELSDAQKQKIKDLKIDPKDFVSHGADDGKPGEFTCHDNQSGAQRLEEDPLEWVRDMVVRVCY